MRSLDVAILVLVPLPHGVWASHFGSAPVHPPKPDDVVFIVDVDPGLDTPCTFRSGGPLRFKVRIDRYVGETSGDGTLIDPQTLIANGVISAKARLSMPAFDVDSSTTPPGGFPEVDKVFFNDRELPKPLRGLNNTWILQDFEMPIEWLKFAARGAKGSRPVPAENEIRIEIDTANAASGQEFWCTAIDWAAIKFKAMAPLLLVHGTNAGPSTWEPAVVDFLRANKIPFEHRIQLGPNASIDRNGRQLHDEVRDWAESFGANRVHLVTHSKGGLDSRRFLSAYYHPAPPQEKAVLSLHTLVAPHRGTLLSDIAVARRTAKDPHSQDPNVQAFLDKDYWVALLNQGPRGDALVDQQTSRMAIFNRQNPFPAGVKLYTYGADADLNNDTLITAAEADPVVPNNAFVSGQTVGTLMYLILRYISTVNVVRRVTFFEWDEIVPVPTGPLDNDLVVTDQSAQYGQHLGPVDRNHSTIKDADSMTRILDRVRADFPVN